MAVTKSRKMDNTTQLDGNIDLGFSTKKKIFSVGGDPNITIEFDPSDLGVTNRLSKAIPELDSLNEKWASLNETANKAGEINEDTDISNATDTLNEFSKKFDELEKSARDIIDNVFDGEVADKLLGNSSAFSPVNGYFKYEHIITAMLKCYEQQIQDEAPKFNKRHTQRYTHKYIKR